MDTKHAAMTSCGRAAAGVKKITVATPTIVSKGSLFDRMLKTKRHLRAYSKGEITRSELESLGIELV